LCAAVRGRRDISLNVIMYNVRRSLYTGLKLFAFLHILIITFNIIEHLFFVSAIHKCNGSYPINNGKFCVKFREALIKVYGVEPAEQILKMCGSQSSKADKINADTVYQYDDEDKSNNFVNIHFPTIGWLGAVVGTIIFLLFLFCMVKRCKPWAGGQNMQRERFVVAMPNQTYDNRMPGDGQFMQQMPQCQARPRSMDMAAGADYNRMFGSYEQKCGQGRLDNYKPSAMPTMSQATS
jgi:hypothetical protein